MNDSVLNEYVHVWDRANVHIWNVNRTLVRYEPLENTPIIKGSLRGTIYFGDRRIPFREGQLRLLIDCDEAMWGIRSRNTGEIAINWSCELPEEHFLCVSYEFGYEEEKSGICWQKEGF